MDKTDKAIGVAWIFIIAITVLDIAFAAKYYTTIEQWELNPFALKVVSVLGIEVAIFLRLFTILACLFLVSLAPRRCQIWSTIVVSLIHIYLAIVYWQIYLP